MGSVLVQSRTESSPNQGGIMRNRNASASTLIIGLDVEELQFYLGLLTQLKADDLITEDARVSAIRHLTDVLARVRDVTKSQSPVSQSDRD